MKRLALALAALCALAFAAPSQAATVTVGTDEGLVSPGRENQGWWGSNFANNNATNDNYITGGNDVYRSYFTFDLSGLVGQVITGLTLDLRRYSQNGPVTLGFFDVSTEAADLAQRQIIDAGIFADLGTGVSYGSSGLIENGSDADILSFILDAAAVADANAAIGGYFSIGVRGYSSAWIFGNSGSTSALGNGVQTLVLTTEAATVPLPAGLPLLLLGLGGLGIAARRRASSRA